MTREEIQLQISDLQTQITFEENSLSKHKETSRGLKKDLMKV